MGSLFSRGPPAGPTSSTEGSAFAPCARMRPRQLQPAYESLGWRAVDGAHPLVYSDVYNVTFYGVEKLHPFDSCKYRRVLGDLVRRGLVSRDRLLKPAVELPRDMLEDVHSRSYLDSLSNSAQVALVVELGVLAHLPNSVLQARVLRPLRTMATGTVMAAGVAAAHGVAINLGGGMHHAS